jgi:hypothetical protein
MINCVNILFSWDIFNFYIVNAVKCVLTFWHAFCLRSFQCDIMISKSYIEHRTYNGTITDNERCKGMEKVKHMNTLEKYHIHIKLIKADYI